MSFKFEEKDIERISELLGTKPEEFGNSWVWHLKNIEHDKPMVVTIYNDVEFGEEQIGPLVSAQTRHGYYELHSIMGYLLFEPDEVIFVCDLGKYVSCLIIGKGNTCSLYSNIRKEILEADFSELEPAVLLSAMQLSIVENIL